MIIKNYYKKIIKPSRRRVLRRLFLVIGAVVIVPAVVFAVYSVAGFDTVYGHQYIGSSDFSGQSRDQVEAALKEKADNFNKSDIELQYTTEKETQKFAIKPSEIGVRYDIDATLRSLWLVGRNSSPWDSFVQQVQSVFRHGRHEAIFSYSADTLNQKIVDIAKILDAPEKDYSLFYADGRFQLQTDRVAGKRVDRQSMADGINLQIGEMEHLSIALSLQDYQPKVSQANAEARLAEANKIIANGSIVFNFGASDFKLDSDTIGGMVKTKTKSDDLEFDLDQTRIKSFVDSLATSLNVETKNAKLTIVGGKVTVFQASQQGQTIDNDKTIDLIKQTLLARATGTADVNQKVALPVSVKAPDVSESAIDSLGIIELVGTATTDFKNSPTNRVHNIQTGAAAINGVLLTPNETFSTLTKLGEISDKSGYLPELVIKENQTVPEFGGGLCQVSSTLFRATLNAGMRIVERQNHSYRVSYYEPPIGMDATIYDPAPDFKFLNNFASHILIQSKVVGTKLSFELYGTKDSRQVSIGTPTTWDPVDPGPPIEILTDTLAPGVRKQTDHAHQGLSAKFHYKVTKDGTTLQETDFISKYVPWQEKWLVGKQPDAAPAPAPTPEATPAPAPTPDTSAPVAQ